MRVGATYEVRRLVLTYIFAVEQSTPRWHRIVGVPLGTSVVILLAVYLVARNISAYGAQPQSLMIGYRLVLSTMLVAPGVALLVWTAQSGDWRAAGQRATYLVGWFLGALVASFVLGI